MLTEETVSNFSIFDVVLPLPGCEIMLPQHAVADELRRILQADDLNLESFDHSDKYLILMGHGYGHGCHHGEGRG